MLPAHSVAQRQSPSTCPPLSLPIHATTKNNFNPAGGGRKTPRQRGVEGRKIGIRCRKTNARLILFLEGTILLSLFL